MNIISPEFLFLFLPISLVMFHLAGKTNYAQAPAFVTSAATLLFFSAFGIIPLILLMISVLVNFIFSEMVASRPTKLLTSIALLFNFVYLFCFKYSVEFGLETNTPFNFIVLVGVSYFTFQQIAYILELGSGRTEKLGPVEYFQFVLFFPIITSGPIVRSREFSGFFHQAKKIEVRNLKIGLAILSIGIAKKVFLADPLAPSIAYVYDGLAGDPSFAEVWMATLGFTLQVYFDFSGYSDIAIGLARMFGIILPLNFLSPLRSTNIQDLWRRWHMSMTRFFSDFIYISLGVTLTRWGLKRGLGKKAMFASTVLLPTVFTFSLVGFWHDAGVNFVLFGLLHGFALTFYQWYARRKGTRQSTMIKNKISGWFATMAFFVFTLVLFRADTFETASSLWLTMLRPGLLTFSSDVFNTAFFTTVSLGMLIVLCAPSLPEFFKDQEVGLTYGVPVKTSIMGRWIYWSPSTAWAAILGLVAGTALVVSAWSGVETFVYVRF